MANYTENYDLVLPEAEDPFDVEDMNGNFAAVDAALYATEQAIADTGEKIDVVSSKVDTTNSRIGTSSSTDTATLFGQLNNVRNTLAGISSVIRSIQHKEVSFTQNAEPTTISITTVTPAKCIVIMERLLDSTTYLSEISYSLAASSLTITPNLPNSNARAKFGFWIIEFN